MKATLVDSMGTDARVVDAARVSFSKLSNEYSEDQNERLLKYLAKYNHFTPFTHPQITMHEKVPIFVARQRFKHTVGFTYNEVSRRYVDSPPEFFTPTSWRGRPEGSAKQGSSDKIIKDFSKGLDWEFAETGNTIEFEYEELMSFCHRFYNDLILAGVAPEQARMVLPQSMYTEYYVTGSLSAWARAYKLRKDAHAQKEIQDLARDWDGVIRPLFPKSWSVLVDE